MGAADNVHMTTSRRVLIEGNVSGETARGDKFCYFADGRDPVTGISSNACTALGGQWLDTTHNDIIQFWAECEDVTIVRNNLSSDDTQGIVTFGTGTNGDNAYRVRVAENTLTNMSINAISIEGQDIEITDNTAVKAADAPMSRIMAKRFADGRIKGGRNVADTVTSPSGVNLAAAEVNGDAGVLPPEAPRIFLPPWMPVIPAVTSEARGVPRHMLGGGIYGTGGIGAYYTINKGSWAFGSTFDTAYEYQWIHNDTEISGATGLVHQRTSDDPLFVKVRGTNPVGIGPWQLFGPV